jgi:hypothetical protein
MFMSKSFLGLSGWDWLTIISVVMVFLGAAFALFLRSKKSKVAPDKNGLIPASLFFKRADIESRKTKWELFWELILVLGLIGDVVAAMHGISETARLNKEAENIGTTNALLWQTNLVLQTNVLALEAKAKDRIITPQQKQIFMDSLKDAPIGVVGVGGRNMTSECIMFAAGIRDMLNDSGYTVATYRDYGGSQFVPMPLPEGKNVWFFFERADQQPAILPTLMLRFQAIGIMPALGTNGVPQIVNINTNEVLIFVPNKFE